MSDPPQAWLAALLRAVEVLGFVARHFHPPEYEALLDAIGAPDAELRAALPPGWPQGDPCLAAATDAVLSGYDGLRAALEDPSGLRAVYRALRHLPAAREALYPLAGRLAPVSRAFLPPERRDDAALLARLARPFPGTGLLRSDAARGGHALYVPEDTAPGTPRPLVMALHGGSGNGRAFLWSWLRACRAGGAILVAPTATGQTWALMGPDTDSPNLCAILEGIQASHAIDPARILLTGMSDGGTFCYVAGLAAGAPFTHLAPVAASFHPMLADLADTGRMRGLPIAITHGALDWMFPASMARTANAALHRAGARTTLREIDDLSHTHPDELCPALLDWMAGV